MHMIFPSRYEPNLLAAIVIVLSLLMPTFGGEPLERDSSGTDRSDDQHSWLEVDRLETDVVVERGGRTFVRFDNGTGKLEITDELDYYEALSDRAREAVDRAPSWLRDNLSRKLVYVGIEGSGLETRPTFGDLDGDGVIDMLVSESSELVFYRNCGTTRLPLFKREYVIFGPDNAPVELPLYNPSLGDLDSDGDLDLVMAQQLENISFFENIGSPRVPVFNPVSTMTTSTGMPMPELVDLNDDGYCDMVLGKMDGTLEYWVNQGSGIPDDLNRNPLLFATINVGGFASPGTGDLDGDGDMDLVLGSSSSILRYYPNLGTPANPIFSVEDPTLFSEIDAGEDLRPSLVALATDDLLDLVLTVELQDIYFYDNIGNSNSPDFRISSTYEAWPGTSYYPPNTRLSAVDDSSMADMVDLLLTSPEHLVDEIAFSIAHTSESVLLRGDVLPEMFEQNARYIYDTAPLLDYVELVEFGKFDTGDYHTTTRYRIIENGTETEILCPRDIYYRFIVHPKITEENPTFIDPDTDGYDAPHPEGNGRFWREYLFYHNDTSYPDDPDPGDDRDMYPTVMSPPLLRDSLSDIDILFNCTRHRAPGDRPMDYGENAVIRVSNWVGKTLILNQQEVSDDERPVQPVRIASTHNGNCGELQDLTIAAARCALIPASGIIMLGEDHVWIEFWERGWHQWDNYWSDSGSIIDNFDNYWYGWGERGGSGIYKWHGNDMIEDVTTSYVPEDVLSDVIVRVTDRNGASVDGARVVIGSHWLMENSVDVPVTVPFPSIWNYTDSDGVARFTLTGNNISIKVISRLGNGAVTKTFIEPGTVYEFNVGLEGRKPRSRLSVNEIDLPQGDTWRIEYEMEVTGAYQRPPNANTGSFHTRPINGGLHMDFAMIPGDEMGRVMSNLRANGYEVQQDNHSYSGEIFIDEATELFFMLSGCDQVETYKVVRLNIILYRKAELRPFVSITEPGNEEMFTVDENILVMGTAVDRENITRLNLTYDDVVVNINHSLHEGAFSYSIPAGTLEEGEYIISVTAENDRGFESGDQVRIYVSSLVPPRVDITAPASGSKFYPDEDVICRGTVDSDPLTKLELKVVGMGVMESIDILDTLSDGRFSFGLDTTGYAEAAYNITVRAVDQSNLIGGDVVTFSLEKRPDLTLPELTVDSPSNYEKFEIGDVIEIEGRAEDNIAVTGLWLSIDGGKPVDIQDTLAEGIFSHSLDTSGLAEGEHEISVEAGDEAGNKVVETKRIVLIEPVEEEFDAPKIGFTEPDEYTVFEYGGEIRIRAIVECEAGLDGIEYSIDGGATWLDGVGHYYPSIGAFTYDLNVSEQRIGIQQFILRVGDLQGKITIEALEVDIRDTRAPSVSFRGGSGIIHYNSNDTVTGTVLMSDLSPIKRIEVRLEGENVRRSIRVNAPGYEYEFMFELLGLEPGDYTVTVEAWDTEGNSASASLEFIIDEKVEAKEKDKGGVPDYIWMGVAVLMGLSVVGGIVFRLGSVRK